jgi:serine protease Do
MMAKELKRPDAKGVLITSVRPGGPVGSAKPTLDEGDVITGAGELEVASVAELIEATHTLTKDATGPTSVLTRFERKTGAFVTVVNVGVEEITDPGLEVKKAWLPVETQVITRDIAKLLGDEAMTGFRVTRVFEESTAEAAGIEVGDLILGLDGENLTASAPEHYEELEALVRQYRAGSSVSLQMRRGGEDRTVEVELVRAPPVEREMKKYRDDDFEFTARDITFFDKSSEKWAQSQKGVIVHQVNPGGWAALGGLANGDLIVQVGDSVVADVVEIGAAMDGVRERKEKAVVFKVMRGIHTRYIEIEPKWSPTDTQKGSA